MLRQECTVVGACIENAGKNYRYSTLTGKVDVCGSMDCTSNRCCGIRGAIANICIVSRKCEVAVVAVAVAILV